MKLSQAHEKVTAAQNRYFDCLEGLKSLNLPDSSSDDTDDDQAQASLLCPAVVVDGHPLPSDVPCVTATLDKPMVDEIGQKSGSLCGIVPLQKKLCTRVAVPEDCKLACNVIGGDKSDATNGNEA